MEKIFLKKEGLIHFGFPYPR